MQLNDGMFCFMGVMLSKYATITENTFEKNTSIARIGMIAAVYAALPSLPFFVLGSLAWGPIQFRISSLDGTGLFTFDAVPGLTLGCVIANVANMALSGTGSPWLDVVFGSLAHA